MKIPLTRSGDEVGCVLQITFIFAEFGKNSEIKWMIWSDKVFQKQNNFLQVSIK
jgi:hypothetical protein